MATTSAWAVGSVAMVTWFTPSAMIALFLTMTAPKGPPCPLRTLSRESWMARAMKGLSMCVVYRCADRLGRAGLATGELVDMDASAVASLKGEYKLEARNT